MNLLQHGLVLALRGYQRIISPLMAGMFGPLGRCRFTPTCSQYAIDAVRAHGAFKGGVLAGWRLCRCQPWGGCGHEPVPARFQFQFFVSARARGLAEIPHEPGKENPSPRPSPLPKGRGGRTQPRMNFHVGSGVQRANPSGNSLFDPAVNCSHGP